MLIKIINVVNKTVPTSNGRSYNQLDVAYTDMKSNKTTGKKIVSFASKAVYDVLKTAEQGTEYEIAIKKNEESGYWDWISAEIAGSGGNTSSSSTITPTPYKSSYETKEDRDKKQMYIIKQSSISNAIASLKTDKTTVDPNQVLEIAQQYVNWITAQPTLDFSDLDDDIPM